MVAKWELFGLYESSADEERIMRGFNPKRKPFWRMFEFRWVPLKIGKELQYRRKK